MLHLYVVFKQAANKINERIYLSTGIGSWWKGDYGSVETKPQRTLTWDSVKRLEL